MIQVQFPLLLRVNKLRETLDQQTVFWKLILECWRETKQIMKIGKCIIYIYYHLFCKLVFKIKVKTKNIEYPLQNTFS